jgi:hypothetical protein
MGIVFGLVVLIALGCLIASFFVRRHGEDESPRPDWLSTDEVFNDPSTGRVMRVWLDGGGERHYVVEGKRPST